MEQSFARISFAVTCILFIVNFVNIDRAIAVQSCWLGSVDNFFRVARGRDAFFDALDPAKHGSLTGQFIDWLPDRRKIPGTCDVIQDYISCIARKA